MEDIHVKEWDGRFVCWGNVWSSLDLIVQECRLNKKNMPYSLTIHKMNDAEKAY